ncbi:MAG: ABC transporter permease [Phycisphaerae bacterium]|nr:ABC transporter permease [Phycisphaerae bacterium]
MRSAWRIALNGLAGRRRRTALLSAAVGLASALVAAASCALASMNAGLEQQVAETLGRAQVRVREIAGDRFSEEIVKLVEEDADVAVAAPRVKGSLALSVAGGGKKVSLPVWGIEPAIESRVIEVSHESGRGVERDGEIVLNRAAADDLGVTVGALLRVERFGPPMDVQVVGIQRSSFNDIVKRFEGRVTRSTFARASGARGQVSEIAVVLRGDADADAVVRRLQGVVPPNVVVQTTALVTSGIDRAVEAQRIGFIIAVSVATLASAFIVLTGLTTNVLERQRELAIMRCIGGERGTLALAQVLIGAIVGALGAGVGVPLGVLLAWAMTRVFADRLPAGLHVSYGGLGLAALGAVTAGMIGASWAAVSAWRTRPLIALSSRGTGTRGRTIVLCGVLGAVLVTVQALIVSAPFDSAYVFWGHVLIGIPTILTGYFLIGVPVVALVARGAGPVVAMGLRLPRALLVGSLTATPLRNGFTAGALMLGLAIMTDLWTTGSALLRDWVEGIRFPDAFVQDLNGLNEEDRLRIEGLDFVEGASPITLMRIDANVFGIEQFQRPPTFFVAFEPRSFFEMTRLTWEAGDPAYAMRRLEEGGAVIVAKEFIVARAGYKVGDTFVVTNQGERHPFEIVGAVSSPGLDVVGYGFDLGRGYAEMAIGSVFGSRADLKRVFKSDAVHLLQLKYSRELPDLEAANRIREVLARPTALVGSGREIKEEVLSLGRRTMRLASSIAVAVMLIGSLGVSNIVLAGIDARRFEFGVLRAVGASRGMLGRLIAAEVIVLVLSACVLGTMMGMQAAFTAARFYEIFAGVRVRPIPQAGPIALGCLMLMLVTLAVISPLIARVVRSSARELLSATRG